MEDHIPSCKFCERPSKYTCPRCNQCYCSAECYKSNLHAQCSELFYRECFMEGLQNMEADAEERHRVIKMLQRLETEAPEDMDSDEEDLEDRMAGVDLDRSEEILNKLTVREKQEFEKMLSDGVAASLVELWTPWWTLSQQQPLIEELQCASKKQDVAVPSVFSGCESIAKLAPNGVSPLIANTVINVLYGYAYVSRLYNGDHLDMAPESSHVVFGICEALGRVMFEDVGSSLAACIAQLDDKSARAHFVSREYSCAVIDDVCRIMSGPAKVDHTNQFILAALSECRLIFLRARKDLDKDGIDDEKKHRRQQLYAAQKKLEFLISWTSSCDSELKMMLPLLEMESCRIATEIAAFKHQQGEIQEALSMLKQRNENVQKPLITEVVNM